MYEQVFQGDVIYMMLYAIVEVLNLVACCYLRRVMMKKT